jgi:protocatechuate 4,5-dioxygenase beta chain
MAKITASVFTSHVPAIGAALDLGKTHEPYWQPLFQGYDYGKQWMKDNKPDVIFLPKLAPLTVKAFNKWLAP